MPEVVQGAGVEPAQPEAFGLQPRGLASAQALQVAEGGGFEPPRPVAEPTRLATERDQPLCQPSVKWSPTQESNLYALRHGFLKPACLPVPPAGDEVAEGRGVEPPGQSPASGFKPDCTPPRGTFRKWCCSLDSNQDRVGLQPTALPFELEQQVEIRAGLEPAFPVLQTGAYALSAT